MPQAVNKVAGILLLFVLICVGTTLLTPGFMSPFNVQNNVRYIAQYGIIGIGVAFVIMTGGIDLSIGSVIGLVGCLLPMFLVEWGWSIPLSLAMVLLVSLAIGMGAWVARHADEAATVYCDVVRTAHLSRSGPWHHGRYADGVRQSVRRIVAAVWRLGNLVRLHSCSSSPVSQ